MIKTLLALIGLRVLDKFIKDNLPNLHWRNIYHFVVLVTAIGSLFVMSFFYRLQKPQPKEIQTYIICMILGLVLVTFFLHRKKLEFKRVD